MRVSPLLLCLLLASCDDKVPAGETGGLDTDTGQGTDEDGDGFSGDDDCVEGDAAINPGATELCDGVDNDCDGDVDEGVTTTVYADNDEDGYGDPEAPAQACEPSAGQVSNGSDCDDDDDDAFPGNTEVCDGVDNDCDAQADESDATGAVTWYLDGDDDGYGEAASWEVACDQPPDHVLDSTDCDDDDRDVNPGENEVCNDVDDDCDGDVDDDDSDVDTSTWRTYYLDGDGDGFGTSETTAACSAPSGYAAETDDCDDATETTWPGATETCDAVDNDCSGVVDDGGLCPCEVDWYGGHAYMFCDEAETWSYARSECETYGYTLVTLSSSDEDAWVLGGAGASIGGNYWIGFTDEIVEGSWGWLSGETVSYTSWGGGEPNDLGGEDCAVILLSDGSWNDSGCGNSNSWVCEDL